MNAGTGFLGFQTAIDAITEALGEPTLRAAVAHHAQDCLELEVRAARGLGSWGGLAWGTWWTSCSTAEFDAGTTRLEATLAFRPNGLSLPAVAEGRWRGTILRLRGGTLQAEGGGYRLTAGRYFAEPPSYDYRKRCDVVKWQVGLDKEFLEAANQRFTSTPKTTHAASESGAAKALRRMARDLLGVELVDL